MCKSKLVVIKSLNDKKSVVCTAFFKPDAQHGNANAKQKTKLLLTLG